MAMESQHVVADVIEVQEFPQLAQAYNVMGVPKTVINDTVVFTGAIPESKFMERVLEAVGEEGPAEDGGEQYSEQTTPIA